MRGWIRGSAGDLLILVSAFATVTLIALAANASLGHAITFGQLGFAAALAFVLLRR